MKKSRMRSLRRKRQKGGFVVPIFGELNPYTRFFGKNTQNLDKTNVAGSPASPDSPDSPDSVIDLTSPSQSPSEAATETPSESPSETPCPTCDACKKGECTLGVDSAAAGLLSDAQKTVIGTLNKGKETVVKLADEGKKKMSDGLMDASLAARPSTSGGGRRKRRRKKTLRRRKKSRGKKKRKTRRKKKSSKRRRRQIKKI